MCVVRPPPRAEAGRLTCLPTASEPAARARCPDQLAGSFYKRHAVRGALPRPRLPGVSGPPLPLRLLVGAGFQVLFHPPCGVLFTFPSRYSCTIGGQDVASLGGWSPLLPTVLRVSRGTQDPRVTRSRACATASPTGLSPAPVRRSRPLRLSPCAPTTLWETCVPHATTVLQPRERTAPRSPPRSPAPVWAAPVSLATTPGLSLDFSSSRY